jgi:transcriptional regulator with XRE-family HTH domain
MANTKHTSGTRPMAATFGGRVRFERQRKQWTQQMLADACGLTSDEIARLEGDDTEFSLGVAVSMAAALNIALEQLTEAPDPARTTTRGVG